MKNLLKAPVCALAGLSLMAGAVAPVVAMADVTGNTGQTQVTLEASADLSNLTITVPTDLVLVADGAGDIIGPKDSGAYDIVNGSVYGVHVSNIKTTALNGTNIVADASASDAKDSISVDMTFTGGTKAPGAAIKMSDTLTGKTNPGIDLGYKGIEGEKNKASATFTGKAKNLSKDYTSGQKVATIDYTFAVGNTNA